MPTAAFSVSSCASVLSASAKTNSFAPTTLVYSQIQEYSLAFLGSIPLNHERTKSSAVNLDPSDHLALDLIVKV